MSGKTLIGGFYSIVSTWCLLKKKKTIYTGNIYKWVSQVVLVVKNLPANAGDVRDTGSIPGLERSPGGGHDNPFQYSCLENPMDRGAWWATVHRVAESDTTEVT